MLYKTRIKVPLQVAQDLRLVSRMLKGDERAFNCFVDEYFPKLYRYALQRLQDPQLVEEVVQEALAQAARRIETYRGEASLLTWLIQICRHEIAHQLRRAARNADLISPFLSDDVLRAVVESIESDTSDNPEARCRRDELISLIQFVLDQLPERYARVLEMKYIDGASSKEIAEHLTIADVAVQSLLARARNAFREICSSAVFSLLERDEIDEVP